MSQPQITTGVSPQQNTPLAFSLKIAGQTITRPVQNLSANIFVHCDMCAANASGTRDELRQNGWGVYSTSAFCPHHEEMI